MCGRFSLITDLPSLQTQFHFESYEEMEPRYNIAPSQNILVIGSNGTKRVGSMMKWGLVPFWAKDTKIGYKMINAKAETLDGKASFRPLLKRRRCLILSDGFYEWKKEGTEKKPFRFTMENRKPFAMAGLWDSWTKGEELLYTCTIITTEANHTVKTIHERMPVILPEDSYDTWLDRAIEDPVKLKPLLKPFSSEKMDYYQVSELVNSPKNDLPDCNKAINSF